MSLLDAFIEALVNIAELAPAVAINGSTYLRDPSDGSMWLVTTRVRGAWDDGHRVALRWAW